MLGDGRDVGRLLEDGVEQVGHAATVDGRDRVGLAEAEVPEGGGLRLVPRVVDLVGDEKDRLRRLAQHAHDVLVGRGGAHRRVDDEEDDVGELDGDLRLHRDRAVDALRVGLPAAGVDDGEPATQPLGLVRHAVAGDAGSVLHDGLAAPEDAVHERGLAHVRAPHDRDHRQRGQVLDAVAGVLQTREEGGVLLVELVVLEARAQRLRAALDELLVEFCELLGEPVRLALVLVLSGHPGLPSSRRSP